MEEAVPLTIVEQPKSQNQINEQVDDHPEATGCENREMANIDLSQNRICFVDEEEEEACASHTPVHPNFEHDPAASCSSASVLVATMSKRTDTAREKRATPGAPESAAESHRTPAVLRGTGVRNDLPSDVVQILEETSRSRRTDDASAKSYLAVQGELFPRTDHRVKVSELHFEDESEHRSDANEDEQ